MLPDELFGLLFRIQGKRLERLDFPQANSKEALIKRRKA